MAVIKDKNLNDLSGWNDKELRKLKINLNNRIKAFEAAGKPKELPKSNPLHGIGEERCRELLEDIRKAEKNLKFS